MFNVSLSCVYTDIIFFFFTDGDSLKAKGVYLSSKIQLCHLSRYYSHNEIVFYQTFSVFAETISPVESSGFQTGYVLPKDKKVLSNKNDFLELS